MRLMTSEQGAETPMDKYIRFKNNIKLWYNEMDRYGLTKEEQKTLEPYFLSSYGVPPSQEQLMTMLMDKNICDFSLKEANAARKIVGKKQMNKIPELHQQILDKAKSSALGQYVWDCGVGPQMGYSFSTIHALAYSFIGYQTAYIATNWNPIYWDAACLVVNSGSLEEDNIEIDENGILAKGKETGTDYGKIAKALGEIRGAGIKVSLVDINKSDYGFKPDVENNQILFGMKALSYVGAEVVNKIKEGRPYDSLKDFMERCYLNKTAMINLIKGGAFDELMRPWAKQVNQSPRILAMVYYLSVACEPKKRLTLQNFNGLLEKGLIPDQLSFQRRLFKFNKYLKAHKQRDMYVIADKGAADFYTEFFSLDDISIINGQGYIFQTVWDKIYKTNMDEARDYIKLHQDEMLKAYNTILFKEQWEKYAQGNISSWEMEALCFYYHEHELANIDFAKYGIRNFFTLSPEPEVDYFFKRNGKEIPIYKLSRIAGTVIGKNDTRHLVTLLTVDGVVNVKFTRDYYAMFNRQLSEKDSETGTKHVTEKGWFTRGVKLLVTGFRRDDTFVSRKYKTTGGHQLYKISSVEGRNINITSERYGENNGN